MQFWKRAWWGTLMWSYLKFGPMVQDTSFKEKVYGRKTHDGRTAAGRRPITILKQFGSRSGLMLSRPWSWSKTVFNGYQHFHLKMLSADVSWCNQSLNNRYFNKQTAYRSLGAQWLSGRVLDLRPRGSGFEPHWCLCVVSLSKTH